MLKGNRTMSKTLFIRKPVASLESELMDVDQHAAQVAEQAVETQAMEHEVETDIEESESTVASLESRMEQLELISAFAGKPIQSFEQAQLTTALAYSAVQGTDLDVHRDVFGKTPTQFNQSFENDGGLTFSAEAIGETLKDMGKATLEKLKQAGKWLYELIVKVFNMFRSKEARVKNLKALVEKGKDVSKVKDGQEIRLTGSQVANVGTATDYAKLLKSYKAFNDESPLFKQLLDSIAVVSEKSIAAYKEKAEDEVGQNIKNFATEVGLDAAIILVDKVVEAYSKAFGITYSGGGEGKESIGTSALIGKKKITIHKKQALAKLNGDKISVDISDYLLSLRFSLEKSENLPESVMVPVLSINDLQNLASDMEQAITGKVIQMDRIEKLAKHRFWDGAFWTVSNGQPKGDKLSKTISKLGRMVNEVVIRPHGLLSTTLQSVTDDYLRYSEVSAKLHASGKEEKAEEQTGSTELATA